MRVLIKNNEKISRFLKENDITRKKLANKLGVSYWNLRHWIKGNRSMPQKVFLNIIKLYPPIKNLSKSEELPDNWGRIKGGKISFKKRNKKEILRRVKEMWKARRIKIKLNFPRINEDFCELYGILLGDGCLSKFKSGKRTRHAVFITGNLINDINYYKNYLVPLLNKLFGLSPTIQYSTKSNAIRIDIRNKSLVEIFLKLGFPLGKKREISISNKIEKLGYKHMNKGIRGLFDTDGSFFARKDEKYRSPYIEITTISKTLREQIKKILRQQGFPAYFHAENVVIRGIKNTNRWFNLIGSSHPVTLKRYNKWKITGKLLPKGLVDQ